MSLGSDFFFYFGNNLLQIGQQIAASLIRSIAKEKKRVGRRGRKTR